MLLSCGRPRLASRYGRCTAAAASTRRCASGAPQGPRAHAPGPTPQSPRPAPRALGPRYRSHAWAERDSGDQSAATLATVAGHPLPSLAKDVPERPTFKKMRWCPRPAVANGTFRELGFDESVAGPKGEEVLLPKGTYVQVQSRAHGSAPLCPSLPSPSLGAQLKLKHDSWAVGLVLVDINMLDTLGRHLGQGLSLRWPLSWPSLAWRLPVPALLLSPFR